MRRASGIVGLISGLAGGLAAHAAEPAPSIDPKTSWFTPELSVNAHPLCPRIFAAAKERFYRSGPVMTPADIAQLEAEETFEFAEEADHLSVGIRQKDSSWKQVCVIRLAPANLLAEDGPAIREAVAAIGDLVSSIERLSPTEEVCPPSPMFRRLRVPLFDSVLYRPWAIVELPPDFDSLRYEPHSHYDLPLTQSASRYPLLGAHLRAFENAERAVAALFVRKNGWPRALAVRQARIALDWAEGLFLNPLVPDLSDDAPLGDTTASELRKAILRHAPMARIRAIDEPLASPGDQGTLLNVAVAYPEALEYLLDRGLDPNRANWFGKTPLMYAVEMDRLDSARMLLDRGADANAATRDPDIEACKTRRVLVDVTPLHFAARYASAAMIRLLLERGALESASADGVDGLAGHYPEDWLRHFGRQADRNVKLSETDYVDMLERLAVPDE